jgi:hypothetical protein
MKYYTLLGLLLFSKLTFSQTLKMNFEGVKDFKIPGLIEFEATGTMPWCNDSGLNPMPYYTPKIIKLLPKITNVSANKVLLEVSLQKIKSSNCNYRFKSFSIWTAKHSGFLSVVRTEPQHYQMKDYGHLEITRNPGARYEQFCALEAGFLKCHIKRDGIVLGYQNGNGSQLYLNLGDLNNHVSVETDVGLNLSLP